MRHVLTIVAVADIARATRFYREVFRLEQRVEAPFYCELADPGGMRVGLYARDAFARLIGVRPTSPDAGRLTGTELYFSGADVELVLARALAANARLLSPLALRDWGEEVAYVADPDGNVIALARASVAARERSPLA